MKNQKPMFIRSVDTETLIEFLREHKDDVLVTYAEMNAALHRTGEARPAELSGALKALLNENQMVFETIMAKGIKLMPPADRLNLSKALTNRTRRATRRVLKKLATVNPSEVDEKDYNAACARTAIIAAAVDSGVQKQIEAGKIKASPTQNFTRKQLAEIFS